MSWSSNPAAANVSILRGERVSFPFDLPATSIHSTLEHLVIPYFGGTAGERTAIIDGEKRVTFNELNARANALAKAIRKRLIVKRWQTPACIGIHMEPSDNVIVAIFAILKLGLAYMPLDTTYPTKRLSRMIEQSKPVCVLTTEGALSDAMNAVLRDVSAGSAPQVFLINELENGDENKNLYRSYRLDEHDKLMSNGDSATACVLYTSGSTGLPKGVIISHRAILHRVSALWNSFNFTSKDVGCFKACLSYVDAITEIFGFLLRGSAVVVAPRCITSTPARFIDLLDKHDVTWLLLVPTLLDDIVKFLSQQQQSGSGVLQPLKFWVMTGEVLTIPLAQKFFELFPGRTLCYLWGATELTGDVTFSEYTSDDIENCKKLGKIPIGTPIQNTNIYVLDEQMQPVDISEPGIAYVSGPNLSDGYLNGTASDINGGLYNGNGARGKVRKEPKRFRYNPFDYHPQHGTLYNTGDYVRAMRGAPGTGDVQLVFEGRTDSRVKIRGFGVDLTEIETGVYEVPGIMSSHVFCHTDEDDSRLVVAYYTARDMSPGSDPETVIDYLRTTLPSFSIPQGVLRVYSFPLLPNGKIDADSLFEMYKDSLLTPEKLEEKMEERRAREAELQRQHEEELERRAEEERQREEDMVKKAEERRKHLEEMMKKVQEEEERRAEERERRLEQMRRDMQEREEELERIRMEAEQRREEEERALEEELDKEIREAFAISEDEVHAEDERTVDAEAKQESEGEEEEGEDKEEVTHAEEVGEEMKEASDDATEEKGEEEQESGEESSKKDGDDDDDQESDKESEKTSEEESSDKESEKKDEEQGSDQETDKKDEAEEEEGAESDEDIVEADHPIEEASKPAVIKLTEDHAAEQAMLVTMEEKQENGPKVDDGGNDDGGVDGSDKVDKSKDDHLIEEVVEELVKQAELDEQMRQAEEPEGDEKKEGTPDPDSSVEKNADQPAKQKAPTPPNTPTEEMNGNDKSSSWSSSPERSLSPSSSSSSSSSSSEDEDEKGVAKDATPDVCREIEGEENGDTDTKRGDTENGDVKEEADETEVKKEVESETSAEKKEEEEVDVVPPVPEKSPEEKLVLSVVSDILRLGEDDFTLEDNYFKLGGDSINAVETVEHLKDGGLEMNMPYFFQADTLGDLTKCETPAESELSVEFEVPGYELVSMHDSTVRELERGCQLAVDGFVKTEPLTAAVDIPEEEKKAFLDTGMKMVAIDGKDYSFLLRQSGNRKIVGMVINMDFHERKVDESGATEQIHLPKLKAFATYSAHLEKTVRDLVDVKEAKQWLIRLATVLSEDVDIGVKASLQKLMETGSSEVAKANNFKGICGVYSHPLTTAVAREAGLEVRREFDPVKDFEHDGEKCFEDVKPPDLRCYVLAKEI